MKKAPKPLSEEEIETFTQESLENFISSLVEMGATEDQCFDALDRLAENTLLDSFRTSVEELYED